MKKTLIVMAALAMVAGVAQAALLVPATVNAADGWYNGTGGSANSTQALIFGPIDGTTAMDRNGMFVFDLPTIPAGQTVASAQLDAYLYQVNQDPSANVDLYARLSASASAYGATEFYQGGYAGDGAVAAGMTGVMNDFQPYVSPQPPVGWKSSGQLSALGTVIQAAYASGTGVPSVPYVQLRVNVDAAPLSNWNLIRYYGEESASLDPTLTLDVVPEPATLGLLGLAGLGAMIARRLRIG